MTPTKHTHARHAANRMTERLLSVAFALAMLTTSMVAPAVAVADDDPAAVPATETRADGDAAAPRVPATDVTVMAFQQSWNTVARECANVYGPSGVKYVQISPPAESVQGTEWWTAYQPVSYRLNSRFGTQQELQSMIETCATAGVTVVADVELNNTTDASVSWVDDQVGVDGTFYNGTYGRYPAFESPEQGTATGFYRFQDNGNNHQYGITTKDFHDCATNVKNFIDVDPDSIWNCRQETRWDLNTADERVQAIQADYLYRLWQLGVRGFRVSSAKFMDPADIAAIKAKLVARIGEEQAKALRFTQEVVYHQGEIAAIQADRYVRNGRVEEFRFAYDLLAALNGDAGSLRTLTDGFVDGRDATVFVANWNTVRGSETLNPSSGARYEMANAFMLANDYGEPMILSDYHFDASTADLAPQGTSDTRVPDVDVAAQCAATADASSRWAWGSWHCQPYWTSTRGMVEFHNAVSGTTDRAWQQPATNVVGFARGADGGADKGFFALNNALVEREATFTTSLPNGTYCNVYATTKRNCAQADRVEVVDGSFTVTLPARGAVAIHDGARHDPEAKDAQDEVVYRPGYEDAADLGRIADTTLTLYHPASSASGRSVQYADASGKMLATVAFGDPVAGHGDWVSADVKGVNAQALKMRVVDASGVPVAPDGADGWHDVGVGATMVWIDASGAMHMGAPFVTGTEPMRTTLTVHVPKDTFTDARGVSVLGTDGTQTKYCAFDAQPAQSSDRRVSCELEGIQSEVTFRLASNDDGAAVSGTRSSYVAAAQDQVSGAIEAWIDEQGELWHQSPELRAASETPQPNDQKNPQQLDVTVHYFRPDGNYQEYDLVSDIWYGWDMWTWAAETESGGMVRFTEHDGFGEIAHYTLTQNERGIRKPQFLIRQGGDAWTDKDPDDEDRLIPESAIRVEAGQSERGVAEIWIVSGDRTVYTYEPQVTGVVFDTQGGGRVPAQTVAVGGHATKPDQEPTRDGHVFAGWTTGAAADSAAYDFSASVSGPTTVYAQWTPAVTVTFDLDYEPVPAGVAIAPVSLAQGSSLKISQNPEREGYDFAGWTSGGSGATIAVGDTLAVNADTTLTAKWQPKRYTVTFDAQGGTFTGGSGDDTAPTTTVTVEHGNRVNEPSAPSAGPGASAGKIFVGWVTEAGGVVSYDFTQPVTGDLTLYAKWADPGETFRKVTLHHHDGADGKDTVGTVYAKSGEPLTLDDPAPRDGYRFDGWASSDGGAKLDPLPTVDEDLELHARWVKVWTVTFCAAGVGGDLSEAPCPSADGGADADVALVDSRSIDDGQAAVQPAQLPQRDGQRLVGWSTEKDGAGANRYDMASPVTHDLVLYAVWERAGTQWTIRFDLNGGTADPAIGDARVYDGERLRNPVMSEETKPTRDGYVFQGWSTVKNDALCLSVFRFDGNGDSLIPIDRNGTLYAIWAPDATRVATTGR